MMITVIVQYRLPASIKAEDCAAHFRNIAPSFQTIPGLLRKQFIYGNGDWAGGVYLWENREAAEKFYSGPWLEGIRERYGMDPLISYFETAAIMDNVRGEIILPKGQTV